MSIKIGISEKDYNFHNKLYSMSMRAFKFMILIIFVLLLSIAFFNEIPDIVAYPIAILSLVVYGLAISPLIHDHILIRRYTKPKNK